MEGRGHVDRSSAVPTRNSDEDNGVVFGSDDFGSTRVAPILLSLLLTRSFFFHYPLSLSWLGCAVDGHQVAAGHGDALGQPGPGVL